MPVSPLRTLHDFSVPALLHALAFEQVALVKWPWIWFRRARILHLQVFLLIVTSVWSSFPFYLKAPLPALPQTHSYSSFYSSSRNQSPQESTEGKHCHIVLWQGLLSVFGILPEHLPNYNLIVSLPSKMPSSHSADLFTVDFLTNSCHRTTQ